MPVSLLDVRRLQQIPTAELIETQLVERLYRPRIIQNDARGDWAEELVGQVLGPPWRNVSGGWHPWDIEWGPAKGRAPERIRIQVRNSAALQTWNQPRAAHASFTIGERRRPSYFKRDNPGVPCEAYGHLCEIYVLAWHGVTDRVTCNQRDPKQWQFYVVAARDLPMQKRISRPRLDMLFPDSVVDVEGLKARVEQICERLCRRTT